jgi:predicted transcriptional regulator
LTQLSPSAKLLSIMLLRLFRKGGASILGPLESEIMNVVWDASAAVTVADVHRVLQARGREIAYSTVKAVLSNLTGKGYLKKKPSGRSNIFVARESRAAFKDRMIRNVLSSLLKEHRAPLMVHLVDDLATDRESIEELENLVRQKRRELLIKRE